MWGPRRPEYLACITVLQFDILTVDVHLLNSGRRSICWIVWIWYFCKAKNKKKTQNFKYEIHYPHTFEAWCSYQIGRFVISLQGKISLQPGKFPSSVGGFPLYKNFIFPKKSQNLPARSFPSSFFPIRSRTLFLQIKPSLSSLRSAILCDILYNMMFVFGGRGNAQMGGTATKQGTSNNFDEFPVLVRSRFSIFNTKVKFIHLIF